MRLTAHAKINVRLVVLAQETGGYHQIETIFCRIALADEVLIERGAAGALSLDVHGAELGPPDDNLVMRAARAWFDAAAIEPSHCITLRKRIPAGAGLGGGSSDAAATLQGLDRLHDDLLGEARLLHLAASLGSDVPFFMHDAPLALAWGRGERMLTHPGPGAAPAVVVMPAASVSTAQAYASLGARITAPGPARLDAGTFASWNGLADVATNDFERVVLPEIPALTPVLALLRGHRARIAQLTGSGAAVFGIFDLPETADAAAAELRAADADLQVFRTEAGV